MRRLPLFSPPPPIAVTDEPVDGGAVAGPAALASTDGFELVAAWQARPPRRARRLSAAVPVVAVLAAAAFWLVLLAAVGVKATLAPRATSRSPSRKPAVGARDITEQGFAQGFARAYLSWDARAPDRHQRQVAAFLSGALDGDGGLQLPA